MDYYVRYQNDYTTNSPEGDFWVGGHQTNDTTLVVPEQPIDTLAYRPSEFRSKQRQDPEIKKGLPEHLHLELPVDGKMKTPIMTWVNEMKHHITLRGMEGVFSIRIDTGNWVQMMDNFGAVTVEQIAASHEWSVSNVFDHAARTREARAAAAGGRAYTEQAGDAWYDKYDKENLRLSATVIKASIGPNLSQRLASALEPGTSGPILFKTALNQVMYMNATTVRTLSNQLGNLSLKSIPGESVSTLTEKVTELAREIEGSGTPPTDLKNLVSKPYTKGTVEAFRTQALGTHMNIMRGNHTGTWQQVVTEHIAVYQDLVQSDEYPPAKGGKKDQDSVIQGLIAKTVDQKLSKLNLSNGDNSGTGKSGKGRRKCFECGSTDHVVKDCPKKSSGSGSDV